MKLTDIWFSYEDKKTGKTYGAKGKIIPYEDPEDAVKELKEFVEKCATEDSEIILPIKKV